MREVKLSALLSTELKSRRKILEKRCTKISSKSAAGFLVAPRSMPDNVHKGNSCLDGFLVEMAC